MSDPGPTPQLPPDYLRRFGGVARLFGSAALQRLHAAHVAVIGVGGVGSWVVEALARSGVGALTLVDADEVCVTNVNRQLPALDTTVGRPKVAVLAERVHAINPGCRVRAEAEFFTAANADRLLDGGYSYVVEATDSLQHKLLCIVGCRARRVPVLTVGGAGGKRDATAVRVADLARSERDRLLRMVRKRLRQRHGFPRDKALPFGVPCVFSTEEPVYPQADGTVALEPEPGADLALGCDGGLGTAAFVTGAFGFAAAAAVVRTLVAAAPPPVPPPGPSHSRIQAPSHPVHLSVACALIERDGRVLVAQRPAGQSLGGKWEFPGGKLEPGETAAAALAREIREELGLAIAVGPALPPRDHNYGTFAITLVPFVCSVAADAIAHPHEHAAVRWCAPAELLKLDWAPADLPVLADYLALREVGPPP